uniref:Aspartic peptidase N-terminal domain-containing protein n=1 Tax=Marmota marmota marmota TaxID=9994 RepID=A0A8C6AEQ9_MARMA
MKWMVVALFCLLALEAVPLRKMKTMRQTMREKGLLGDFLRTHKYDPAQKYRFSDFSVLYEPMTYMDVSPRAPGVPVPAAKPGVSLASHYEAAPFSQSCQPGPPC